MLLQSLKPIKKIFKNLVWYKKNIITKTSKNIFQKLTLNIDNKTISDDCVIGNHFNNQ